jgi:hypothetical protein
MVEIVTGLDGAIHVVLRVLRRKCYGCAQDNRASENGGYRSSPKKSHEGPFIFGPELLRVSRRWKNYKVENESRFRAGCVPLRESAVERGKYKAKGRSVSADA